MTYKETFYFVAKCLTISLEHKNREEIEKQLQSNNIDWDAVVKVSTAHYVFPALYCNLKRADFLKYIPEDLVAYMEEITNLNRDRNTAIIQQAKELNALLVTHNCTPIFLKGTGNLLSNLYEDTAERMVGDIDFIFSKEDYPKAIAILYKNGYERTVKSNAKIDYVDHVFHKHYPRLHKENNIAAVEVHKEYLMEKYIGEFNYKNTHQSAQTINGVRVLSYANKVNLTIIANQINDRGYHYKNIGLRNAYDVFLLSKQTVASKAMGSLKDLKEPLECFIATTYEVFNMPASLQYNSTKAITTFLKRFQIQFSNPSKTKRRHRILNTKILLQIRLEILWKAVVDRKTRIWVFYRLSDPKWCQEKWKQTITALIT